MRHLTAYLCLSVWAAFPLVPPWLADLEWNEKAVGSGQPVVSRAPLACRGGKACLQHEQGIVGLGTFAPFPPGSLFLLVAWEVLLPEGMPRNVALGTVADNYLIGLVFTAAPLQM